VQELLQNMLVPVVMRVAAEAGTAHPMAAEKSVPAASAARRSFGVRTVDAPVKRLGVNESKPNAATA
jgi:hypothetical protein